MNCVPRSSILSRRVGLRVLVLVVSQATAPGLAEAATLHLRPCHLDGLAEVVRCGAYEVAEDSARPDGRRISLQLAVLPAVSRRAEPDPIFLLAGGPGQGARALAALANAMFRVARRHRDLVLVDLRGTGDSNPFRCPPLTDPVVQAAEGHPLAVDVETCLQSFAGDPRLYTHEQAMTDLDAVRAALGYERINLWGGSYGTRAALIYARRFPERVRAAILDGAAPLDIRFPLSVPADGQRALDRLLADCAKESACAAAYPMLGNELAALLDRLEREPVRVSVAHPRTGEPLALTLDRHALAMSLRVALYSTEHSSLVPFLVHRAAAGDFAPLVALAERGVSWSFDTMAQGTTLSVLCSEDVPRLTEGEIAAQSKGTFLGRAEIDEWRAICARWPVATLPRDVDIVHPLAIPALILSGELDPVTPPRWGEAMAKQFPRGTHVVVPGAAHNVSYLGCVPELMARFLERGTADGLDTACVAENRRPPFFISAAGPSP